MDKQNICEGDGKCFSIEGNIEIFPTTKTTCSFKCQSFACEVCGTLLPEYNCINKKCISCSMSPDLFNNNNLSTTKLSLSEFMKRMNELPIQDRLDRFNSLSSESDHKNWDKLYMLNLVEESDEYKWLKACGYINYQVVLKEQFFEYLPKKLHSYYKWLNAAGDPNVPSKYHYPKMLIHKFFEKWVHIILSNKDGEYIRGF